MKAGNDINVGDPVVYDSDSRQSVVTSAGKAERLRINYG